MGGPGAGVPQVEAKANAQSLFVLAGATLVKYDGTTLKEQGKLQLIEAPKLEAKADVDQPQRMVPPPPCGGSVLLLDDTGKDVIVILGRDFIRVNAATLKIEVKGTLAPDKPKQDIGQPGGGEPCQPGMHPEGPGMQPMPPVQAKYELKGRTLYVFAGPQITALNIDTGKTTGTATIPQPKAPKPDEFQPDAR